MSVVVDRVSQLCKPVIGIRSKSYLSLVKEWYLIAYAQLYRPLARIVEHLLKRDRVTVLVYHRVDDSLRDSVTVGVHQFDEQMRYLRQRCNVISTDDLVAGSYSRDFRKPTVAVTFDDGYLDNYENAVPTLRKYGIPATFFVSTGIIDSSKGFAHDYPKLGYSPPTMTWNQLREMKDLGFIIGGHTENHIRCSEATFADVVSELEISREQLRKQLHVADPQFAYPYGGARDITESVRAEVKRLGYSCCFSAYGGNNLSRTDPFDLKRVGVDHGFSQAAFAARVEGYQLRSEIRSAKRG